jgi:hypothetical protein
MAAAFHLCKWRSETKEGTAHNVGASSADAPWLKLEASGTNMNFNFKVEVEQHLHFFPASAEYCTIQSTSAGKFRQLWMKIYSSNLSTFGTVY